VVLEKRDKGAAEEAQQGKCEEIRAQQGKREEK